MNAKNALSATSASRLAALVFFSLSLTTLAHAQGSAPELFGVREVVVSTPRFDDMKAAESCGLTRDQITTTLMNALKSGNVPAIAAVEARPVSIGVARVDLVPEIYVYPTESLECISVISLTAQNKTTAVIAPVSTLRRITAVYWQQHAKLISGLTSNAQKTTDIMQKMAVQFAQQYRADQPQDQPQ